MGRGLWNTGCGLSDLDRPPKFAATAWSDAPLRPKIDGDKQVTGKQRCSDNIDASGVAALFAVARQIDPKALAAKVHGGF